MTQKSGFVAVIGRPNVGKSTLINALLGQKVAAVSPRAQTTRRRQLGILTEGETQVVFVDTPGLHTPRTKLGEYLNLEAEEALKGVDLILWMLDAADAPSTEDQRIGALLAQMKKRPALWLVLNKIDLIPAESLPTKLQICAEIIPNSEVFPISAIGGAGKTELRNALLAAMPEGEPEFDAEQVTDFFERDIAADLIREACLLHLRDEIPHGVNVRIDEYTERGDHGALIHATIFVEKDSHKGIVIGEGGNMLKKIGITARQQIEEMSGRKVFLELRAKIEKDWRDDESALRRFGYKVEIKKKKR